MVDAKQAGTATVSLVDMNGREVAANNIFLQQGLNSADVDFSGAASGIYQVVIRQQENLQISRLVIR
jgi:hypothetical protein